MRILSTFILFWEYFVEHSWFQPWFALQSTVIGIKIINTVSTHFVVSPKFSAKVRPAVVSNRPESPDILIYSASKDSIGQFRGCIVPWEINPDIIKLIHQSMWNQEGWNFHRIIRFGFVRWMDTRWFWSFRDCILEYVFPQPFKIWKFLVAQTQAILFLKSMSENVGSDLKGLWIWMSSFSINFDSRWFQSLCMSDPPHSDIDFKNKMGLVWGILKNLIVELIWEYFQAIVSLRI